MQDVMIIGAGPVGLSLGLALARQGVMASVYEADRELNQEVRASTFHPPTLELFEQWGVVAAILAKGHVVEQLQYWEREPRQLVAAFDYSLIHGDTPFPFRLQCPQHVATRVLKPLVEAAESTRVNMGHRLVGFHDHGSHVTATFETPLGLVEEQARYLCAADGSNSTVRGLTGMAFEGMTYEDRFLLVGSDLAVRDLLPGAGPVCYIFDPEEWVIILNLPDIVRVVFRMKANETVEISGQPQALRDRVNRFFGKNLDFDILTTQLYRVHQRVAAEFRRGNTFLLGDAAHINNPAGGMGMNSGIHDAAHLAQALPSALHSGQSDPLQAYAIDRRTAALEMVSDYTDKQYQAMTLTDAYARQIRNRTLAETAANPGKARAYLLKASMLGNRI